MTPAGQQRRHSLLQRLFDLVHTDGAGQRRISHKLFRSHKGKKLLADLLPLWTAPHVQAALLAFASQLPEYVQQPNPAPHVPPFSSALASAPKQLPAEDCAALLEVVTAHDSAVLRAGLQFQELCALLLGLLCHTASAKDPRNLAALAAFYGLLVPLATKCERVWAVLNAVLPTADSTHTAMLAELIGCESLNAKFRTGGPKLGCSLVTSARAPSPQATANRGNGC